MARNYRPIAERQAYHFEKSKKGSYEYNPKTGEYKELTDFKRGVHLGKAQMLQKKRIQYAKKMHRKKEKDYNRIFNGR